jgi:hypothetical protein
MKEEENEDVRKKRQEKESTVFLIKLKSQAYSRRKKEM